MMAVAAGNTSVDGTVVAVRVIVEPFADTMSDATYVTLSPDFVVI
jgi:uncharacterized protein (DUF433 family)